MRPAYRDQALLVAFVLLVSIIPFSNRAVYMDEHLYLGLAQSALQHPLYPQDTPWLYFGTWFPNAADHTHPPLGEYHLALLYKVLGHFSERSFRILFGAPYAILAVLGFYGLAARWTRNPFWVSLLLAGCPPFLVMSPALMMDLPSVACLLIGLRIFLSQKAGAIRLAASAVFFTAALGMAYTAAIPLCALLLVWCLQVLHIRWESRLIPRLGQGGVDATSRKMLRSHRSWSGRARSASAIARSIKHGSFNCRLIGGVTNHPVCAMLRWLREIFLIAQPPLLGQGGELARLVAIIAPFVVLAVWLLAMTIHFGEFPLEGTVRYALSQFKPLHNLAATFSFIGGLAVLPWSFSVFKGLSRISVAVSLIAAAVPLFLIAWPSTFAAVLYFAFASWGIALILRTVGAVYDRPTLFLLLWFIGSMVFFIFAADMMTARYLLLYLPPLYLVLFKDTPAIILKRVCISTVALSICIAIADYRFVGGYRAWVDANIPVFTGSGYRLWSATESGLRFYLEQRGAQGLDSRSLQPGGTDLVIQHSNLFRYSLADGLGSMLVEVKEYEINDWFPLRTFNRNAGAGFHDSRIGMVPFTVSGVPMDSIVVTQVSPFAPELPVPADDEQNDVPVWTPQGIELKQARAEVKFDIPYLRNVEWSGELTGPGIAELGHRSITLRLSAGDTAVWRNFRIIPKGF